jgi:hypothetical protein
MQGTGTGTIRDNIFISNRATINGAGEIGVINVPGGEIFNNYFEGNTHALYSYSQSAHVKCNRFFQNQADTGRYVITVSGIVESNVFDSNTITAPLGSIIALNGSMDFKQNLVINNSVTTGSIITTVQYNTSGSIHDNDFTNNSGANCLRLQGGGTFELSNNNFTNPAVQFEVNNFKSFGTPDIQADSNYWGNRNTVQIESVIHDFFDDASLSVVQYPPVLAAAVLIDTMQPGCNRYICGSFLLWRQQWLY